MKHIHLSALAIFFIGLISCGEGKKEAVENEKNWKTLSENNYSIHYPESWEVDKSGKLGMSFMLLSKLTSDKDEVRENVNLLVQDLPGGKMSLDKYVEISEGQIKSVISNASIIESTRENSDEFEYHKVLYTGDEGENKFKFEQHIYIKNGKAYVLTLTCELDQFDKYKEDGEKILNSFRFSQ